ncbi:hypothetical protein DICSQDRAFT_130307 [Dichomitus squalens LYAD-421 SS1]|uniref:Uncharacterized protein n=1 Tax=Dichomitus squalens (strain LYAD-421) TaxID=732165 RepID=R7SIN7_DICSQ|nr:uncharacterized protein DICSQDRAFT_130307 [Dichomitus squalens LYAD-421 SS1]EJF56031.1 hypothetical protein DICSQDRAFT_130307 [Dichomitus squalens LYAD-421 SS1]
MLQQRWRCGCVSCYTHRMANQLKSLIDFLQKGSISEIAGKLSWWFDAQAMLETLDLILTYLGESEDARRGTPGDFLEAVGELVTYIDGEASRDSWPWNHEDVQEALKNLKRSFEKCKSLGLGVGAEEASIQAFPLDPQLCFPIDDGSPVQAQ